MRPLRRLSTQSQLPFTSALCASSCCAVRAMAAFLSPGSDGAFLVAVHAKPGARTSSLAAPLRLADAALEVRIAAPPVEGKANAELEDYVQSAIEAEVRELSAMLTTKASASSSPSTAESVVSSFFAGTSYEELLTHANPPRSQDRPDGGGVDGKSKKNKKNKSAASGTASSSPPSAPSLVSRLVAGERCSVAVELARGSTSKSKALAVQFPGNEAELVGVLQRIARE